MSEMNHHNTAFIQQQFWSVSVCYCVEGTEASVETLSRVPEYNKTTVNSFILSACLNSLLLTSGFRPQCLLCITKGFIHLKPHSHFVDSHMTAGCNPEPMTPCTFHALSPVVCYLE